MRGSPVGASVAAAATFVWLGMVLGISFLEAPLKFRAPGVTLPIGLGIGRLVFRVLNLVEVGLLVVAVVGAALGDTSTTAWVLVVVAAVVLAVQLLAVRPALNRRSDAVLAAADPADAPRSRAHLFYVGLELVKVLVLIALGSALLAG